MVVDKWNMLFEKQQRSRGIVCELIRNTFFLIVLYGNVRNKDAKNNKQIIIWFVIIRPTQSLSCKVKQDFLIIFQCPNAIAYKCYCLNFQYHLNNDTHLRSHNFKKWWEMHIYLYLFKNIFTKIRDNMHSQGCEILGVFGHSKMRPYTVFPTDAFRFVHCIILLICQCQCMFTYKVHYLTYRIVQWLCWKNTEDAFNWKSFWFSCTESYVSHCAFVSGYWWLYICIFILTPGSTYAITELQYIPRNMHTVLLCFALLWLCNRS